MFDLDGTLLNEAKQVTDKTKQVLETMKSMGIRMGVATGRPLAPVMQQVKEYGIELVKYEELDQKTKGYMDYYYQNQIYKVLIFQSFFLLFVL